GVAPQIKKQRPESTDLTTNYKGRWELVSANAGVSAMHLIVLPNNKAVMFDSTVLGPSQLRLPQGHCRRMPNGYEECWAHAAEFDIETGAVRPLLVNTDTWCSSGGLNVNGTLVQAGGWLGGGRAVRYLQPCDTCDWIEYPDTLSGQRWYSTQQILPDGSFIVVGGRGMMNYEFIPAEGARNPVNYNLPLLVETTDKYPGAENNLYPHVHLSTDGNLFILATDR
ncbi:hypothetical protein, partial [Ralstonia pseudosolanacearum]|uniref:hypothetical protein n=1 Tax=Ralstonia pseudosolanacearum TaxID=1310165 RepID=UPI003CF55793